MRGMSTIVQVVARLLAGMLFLFGTYVVLHGHLTPGGGFAGGVLIAAAFILMSLASGSVEHAERSSYTLSSVVESLGGILFLGLALAGYVAGTHFFQNATVYGVGTPLQLISGGIILPTNIAIGIKVGAGLFAMFLALGASRFVMKD
ncbi:cation:proton antiporter [candidate division WOR-3 bacterium]|uniref:Cation:proton antiporter n=1 Tax=candidate division WOR-3 bacterium TaxID=2052148 RepID=A0A937XED5_UNCW3|nr:cation:proton antiporter [candidate division WOR-3 bacterium]